MVASISISLPEAPTLAAALTVNTSVVMSLLVSCPASTSVMVPTALIVMSPEIAALTTPSTTPPPLVVVRFISSVLAPPSAWASVATILLA